MRRLIIGNVDCEAQCGNPEKRNLAEKCQSSRVAHRLAWFCRKNSILSMPCPISNDFLNYVGNFFNFDIQCINQINASENISSPTLITHSYLNTSDLIDRIKHTGSIKEIICYFPDRSMTLLYDNLNLKMTSNLKNFFVKDYYLVNRKSYFRHIATKNEIPIAKGGIVNNLNLFKEIIKYLLLENNHIIIKKDLAGGGEGNAILRPSSSSNRYLGITFDFQYNNKNQIDSLLDKIWHNMTNDNERTLVIEEYLSNRKVFYSELEVLSTSKISVLNYGLMRMDPTWVGFEIPLINVPNKIKSEFLYYSHVLAKEIADLGYIGKINIDGLQTDDNRLVITEINVRLGGCSHIHEIAFNILGADYLNKFNIYTRNYNYFNGNLSQLIDLLIKNKLHFNKDKKNGVIVTQEDLHRTKTFEYMMIAKDKAVARLLENKLLNLLARRKQ